MPLVQLGGEGCEVLVLVFFKLKHVGLSGLDFGKMLDNEVDVDADDAIVWAAFRSLGSFILRLEQNNFENNMIYQDTKQDTKQNKTQKKDWKKIFNIILYFGY